MTDTEQKNAGEQSTLVAGKMPPYPDARELILITGGTGFIGSRIIEKLSDRYRIVVLDQGGNSPVVAECIYMDLTSTDSMVAAFDRVEYAYGNKIASVIHLAAYYDFSGKPSPMYDRVTVHGTHKLLLALKRFEVDQFLFSSSLLVYRPTRPGRKTDEDSRLDPSWDYPKSKVRAENVIFIDRGIIPALILRIAGVYTDKGNSIPLANHIQRIYEKQLTSHFFPGEKMHGNPFVHLDDLVDAIVLAIENRKRLPQETIVNIGEAETLSFDYLQKSLGSLLHHKEWKTYRIPGYVAKAGAWVQDLFGDPFIKPWMIDMADDHMELDISKAKNVLGWEPKHTLAETLPKIVDALARDPKKWYKENKLKG